MGIAIFFLFALVRLSQQGSGSLATNQATSLQPTYAYVGPTTKFINVVASFTGLPIPSTLIYGKIGGDPGNKTINDLQHVNPYNRMDMDPEGMYVGRLQYLNFPVTPGTPATLYLRITDFTTTTRKNNTINYSYTITQSTIGPVCPPCAPGTNHISPNTSCVCGPCSARYRGIDCAILYTTLANGVQSQATVSSLNQRYLFFDIPSTNSMILTYQISAGYSQLGIQFKSYQDQLAGYPNVIVQGFQMAVFPLQGTQPPNSLSITASGSQVSICIVYYGNSNGLLNISYQQSATSNVLVIVLGVLGGVLFIALVVAACYIAKKARSPGQVQGSGLQQNAIPSDDNRLSDEQLNKYFPPVICSAVFNSSSTKYVNTGLNQESSIAAIKMNPTKKEQDDRDCVICLCPVAPPDLMRGTYCRHLFHSTCLQNWLKKQRNCPYCRQQFDRKGVVAHYTRLVRLEGGKILAGVDLVKAIFFSRIGSKLEIEDVKDIE